VHIRSNGLYNLHPQARKALCLVDSHQKTWRYCELSSSGWKGARTSGMHALNKDVAP
jgi:hypothetical protein